MDKKLTTIQDLHDICLGKWSELDDIKEGYLSDMGLAAKKAYRIVVWHCAFYDTLEDLYNSQEFQDYVNLKGQDEEFYRVFKKIYRAIEKAIRV